MNREDRTEGVFETSVVEVRRYQILEADHVHQVEDQCHRDLSVTWTYTTTPA